MAYEKQQASQSVWTTAGAREETTWMRPLRSESLLRTPHAADIRSAPSYTPNDPRYPENGAFGRGPFGAMPEESRQVRYAAPGPSLPCAEYPTAQAAYPCPASASPVSGAAREGPPPRRSRVAERRHVEAQAMPAPPPSASGSLPLAQPPAIAPRAAAYPPQSYPSVPFPPRAEPAPAIGNRQAALEADGWDDDLEDAVPTTAMAAPAPVPLTELLPPKQGRRKGLWAILGALVLAAVGILLWRTGLLEGLLPSRSALPVANNVPALFSEVTPLSLQTLSPAVSQNSPQVEDFTADASAAVAPATLTFRLRTNAAASSIRLLSDDGVALPATMESMPEGDGTLWVYQVAFSTPYQGGIHVYARDADGVWSNGGASCQIDVQ